MEDGSATMAAAMVGRWWLWCEFSGSTTLRVVVGGDGDRRRCGAMTEPSWPWPRLGHGSPRLSDGGRSESTGNPSFSMGVYRDGCDSIGEPASAWVGHAERRLRL